MITIVLAGVIALLGTLFGTRLAIAFLVRKGYGQLIRDDGPTSHHTKRGTPTMGGIVIVLSVLVAYVLSHLITMTPPRMSAILILFLLVGLGLVGFLDDWIKISKQRSLGLRSKAKLAGQVLVGLAFAWLSFQFPDERSGPAFYEPFGGITPASPAISFLRDIPPLVLPIFLAIPWLMLLIAAASNGMNLTDGLDGLAAGASVMVFGAYTLVNIWQYNQSCAYFDVAGPKCYEVRDPHDLAVVAVSLAGACFGFLWWNCQPAKIFMGDTGSLSLGGAMAGMAIYTRTELLLLIIGGLFVINTLSVILQVSFFRVTGGKRLFPMAPLHHTFELRGWAESTVVIRFWIIAGLFVAAGLALFYAEWVTGR
ncbi:phospho-N-acetylmuramoyl-pentapeptide-transferase [Microlunatus sp. Y2014]|uniref:phospho-N-acetylmuramoyl-pentapeptide- transferase n=1 Tax=Microlunatus sp. Y2014 TaxID=3418488 RepID=UPI003DA6F066